MNYTGINHLAMVTSDMALTIRYWRDLLEMPLISGFGEDGFRHYFFEIDAHNTIAFFEWDGAEPLPQKLHGIPHKGPIIFDHISLGLASADDAWKLKDAIAAAGFTCSDMIDHGFIHSFYTFDPNGIPLEFSYCVEGKDIHRNHLFHDTSPLPIALEGSEPQKGKWPTIEHPTPLSERVVKEGDGSGFFQHNDV